MNSTNEQINEVERLRELLNRAIGYTKDALFFARSYENKNQWNEIDKLWDLIRDLEKETLAPEETQDGATMSEWYGGFSKIESTDPVPTQLPTQTEWRKLGLNEVIQEGDEYNSIGQKWIPVHHWAIGKNPSYFTLKFRTCRQLPKPTLTRESYDEDWNLKTKQEEVPLHEISQTALDNMKEMK